MAGKKILITGGAGFVGSHTADRLLKLGCEVRVYDSLREQVHGVQFPSYLAKEVEFIRGDMRNLSHLTRVVRDVEVIYHLAAAVGVGQSMYRIADYTATNTLGTANLLQAVLDSRVELEKIIVASSMSIYGEGEYSCSDCGEVAPAMRSAGQLQKKKWELSCPQCGQSVSPIPTRESKPLNCSSIYALSKKDQEEMVLLFGRTYDIPAVALRYFNIYGTRQALSNPYTGVVAIFASRLMNGNPPVVFEDGSQLRDFVSVHDIVEANILAMDHPEAHGMALNIGSGQPISIREIATELANPLGVQIPIEITGKYRAGDIRHCFADISRAARVLGYQPKVKFSAGLKELVSWLQSQSAKDRVADAIETLEGRGLVA
ncbi:MAG: SDR family NAD(P)-dependent oxidoreductase [Acidobacteria bacterium]|nr:SDR family NAD(P)-dependent oxidoreductase [Acidobacteriota bacterium]MBV8891103.1 SDR family NAD(P)-dependent oxidoreductase [Acidobacteriota bacterium]MBV9479177.1 SDR family NAD(P)-dependent oxidoreductase [Acidobacteriota bacterium]